ncbi:MAG: hypothetical protein JWM64_1207 [Frankiales bacterium]|nr:hypothetical protein [Frankiales bacterium]
MTRRRRDVDLALGRLSRALDEVAGGAAPLDLDAALEASLRDVRTSHRAPALRRPRLSLLPALGTAALAIVVAVVPLAVRSAPPADAPALQTAGQLLDTVQEHLVKAQGDPVTRVVVEGQLTEAERLLAAQDERTPLRRRAARLRQRLDPQPAASPGTSPSGAASPAPSSASAPRRQQRTASPRDRPERAGDPGPGAAPTPTGTRAPRRSAADPAGPDADERQRPRAGSGPPTTTPDATSSAAATPSASPQPHWQRDDTETRAGASETRERPRPSSNGADPEAVLPGFATRGPAGTGTTFTQPPTTPERA